MTVDDTIVCVDWNDDNDIFFQNLSFWFVSLRCFDAHFRMLHYLLARWVSATYIIDGAVKWLPFVFLPLLTGFTASNILFYHFSQFLRYHTNGRKTPKIDIQLIIFDYTAMPNSWWQMALVHYRHFLFLFTTFLWRYVFPANRYSTCVHVYYTYLCVGNFVALCKTFPLGSV